MKVHITHSTTACVLLEIGDVEHGRGVRILTDPVLDTKEETYPFLPFPLSLLFKARRSQGPKLAPTELPPHKPIDLVLLSHAHHGDNLDHAGEAILPYAHEIITSALGKRHLRYKASATGLKPWWTTTHFARSGAQLRITATPAHHRPAWIPEGHDVIGFLIEWDAQTDKEGKVLLEAQEHGAIYISGDTVYFNGLREMPQRLKTKDPATGEEKVTRIGTALLHLGAVNFGLPFIGRYTFNGHEAVRVATELDARQIIPLHYESEIWDHFTESRDSYKSAFAEAQLSSRVTWLEPGLRTEITV